MTDGPQKAKRIVFDTDWPYIRVVSMREPRTDHAVMAAAMTAASVAAWYSPILPAVAGYITAFIAGYAACNWLSYPHLYGGDGE